jgi:hypothetical protein
VLRNIYAVQEFRLKAQWMGRALIGARTSVVVVMAEGQRGLGATLPMIRIFPARQSSASA